MVRLAVAILGFVLLAAAAYFAPCRAAGLCRAPMLVPLFSAIALVVSLSPRPRLSGRSRNAGKLRDDIQLLARSIDVALRDMAARTDKETATISDMSSAVSREIERLSERIATTRRHHRRRAAGANADNVVPHPAARRPRVAAGHSGGSERRRPITAPSKRRTARRWRPASSTSRCSRSSRCRAAPPAASRYSPVCRSRAASASICAGRRNDCRASKRRCSSASWSRRRCRAGRRRLGAASTTMPLHVAISDAILVDAKELAPLLDMLQFYPDLAQVDRAVDPERPARLPRASTRRRWRCCRAKGVRFACGRLGRTADTQLRIGGRRHRLPQDPGQSPARPRKTAPQARCRPRRSSKARGRRGCRSSPSTLQMTRMPSA